VNGAAASSETSTWISRRWNGSEDAGHEARAHLKWEARGKQDTFYLERLERSAVLVGRSPLCDLRVPAGPKHHVLVLRNRTGFEVRNLSAWHRMRVNGEVVAQAHSRAAT